MTRPEVRREGRPRISSISASQIVDVGQTREPGPPRAQNPAPLHRQAPAAPSLVHSRALRGRVRDHIALGDPPELRGPTSRPPCRPPQPAPARSRTGLARVLKVRTRTRPSTHETTAPAARHVCPRSTRALLSFSCVPTPRLPPSPTRPTRHGLRTTMFADLRDCRALSARSR